MVSSVVSTPGASCEPRQIFADAFRLQMQAVGTVAYRCRIPRLVGLYERHPKMHYHFKPELFIQLAGVTEFAFPEERFSLHAGEICIVPKGMPHGEIARGDSSRFENIVVSFFNDKIDIHLAHEVGDGQPAADEVHFFVTDLYPDLIAFLDRVCLLHDDDEILHARAIKGLLVAEFALLATTVEGPTASPPVTIRGNSDGLRRSGGVSADMIALCQRLVQQNLQEEGLSVDSLAEELGCAPTYLSKLFRRKVGERLVEYINRLRVQNAIDALRYSRLSVKGVAAACGFSDANYFARVFRRATRRSPREFRADFQAISRAGKLAPVDTTLAHDVDKSVTIEGDGVNRDADIMAARRGALSPGANGRNSDAQGGGVG